MSDLVIMSFKPIYAREVLDRLKTCEIRYCVRPFRENSLVIVYASSPIKAVLGYFRAGYTTCIKSFRELEELCRRLDCKIPRDNWEYVSERYRYSRRILLTVVKDPVYLDKTVKLSRIRLLIPGFNPPQSYKILRPDDPIAIKLLELVGVYP
ncbi:MAG: hypothetical protein ABWW65_07560 [Thermoprotei archaeon]